MSYRIGIDVGGTFTDLIAIDSSGNVNAVKTPSTPDQPSRSIADGLALLTGARALDLSELLADTELIVHGSTAALNALIELKGARTALLCTAGFRDSLEIRLGAKERRYDWGYAPPAPLVPRSLRLPVRERVSKTGAIHTPLVDDDIHAAIEVLRRASIEAVAVCFLWSFRNDTHERRVGEILAAALPDVYVSLSVDVLPEIREYDRTSTTVVNAYIGPVVRRYVRHVEAFLTTLGYRGAVRFMQSNAGLAAADEVMRRPVFALGSGPAAGPAAGLFHARPRGRDSVLTVDMGGTSFDVCLVENGEPKLSKGVDYHRYRIGVQMVDIHAVGAGGGSIASVDVGGLLQVGPESAGAAPGPACYDKGGTCATVTDANLVLGYLGTEGLLGGQIALNRELAERALDDHVARPLGLSVEAAAHAVYAVVNNNMARAIREVSVERGHDPRDFLLVVGGGCGPVHAWMLAREIGVAEVLIPKVASSFCAFGEVVADLRHTYSRSTPCRVADAEVATLEALFAEMENEGRATLVREGVSSHAIDVLRRFDLRYAGQMYECMVNMPAAPVTRVYLDEVVARFHAVHEALYAYAEPDNPLVELITIGSVVSDRSKPEITLQSAPVTARTPRRQRNVYMDAVPGFVAAPVYQGGELAVGSRIEGPAVVEEEGTSIVVFADALLTVGVEAYELTKPTREQEP
ncbi:MAG TPA: hydantoinase/oxoprolinase family protein [Gammaproteobacteria bacterium]|nr:hydantoinase/oxoprolinase family protein [Gammaproteobacteria bacterium]